jgi:hypothetical protein
MHNIIVGPFSADTNIISTHLQKGLMLWPDSNFIHMSDSLSVEIGFLKRVPFPSTNVAGFQCRSLKISRFSLKVALLWETLPTVQNFMLSGKYLVMMTTTTTTIIIIYFRADTAVTLAL